MSVTRRTILRSGALVAWTAPLVLMGVPAHAAACSGGSEQLLASEVDDSRTQQYDPEVQSIYVKLNIEVDNAGAAGHLLAVSIAGATGESFTQLTVGQGGIANLADENTTGTTPIDATLNQ